VSWRRVLVLVEGQTEELFVKRLLAPHLAPHQVQLRPTIVETKRPAAGPPFKGGVTKYSHVKRDLKYLLHDTDAAIITTMLDYYALPEDFPGYCEAISGDYAARVSHLEQALAEDIGSHRFVPYLQVHEFEALLFVQPQSITHPFGDPSGQFARRLQAARDTFRSPEEIDNEPETCPHRRIRDIYPGFSKKLHGPMIAQEIGIEAMRRECSHFNEWLSRLEAV